MADLAITYDAPVSREEWLAQRRRGVAATDLAPILGLSPWRTALDVFAEKLDLAAPRPESRVMRLGKALEPILCSEYEVETGRALRLNEKLYLDALTPLRGTPDAFDLVETDAGAELKTSRSSLGWGEPYTDEIPDHYLIQCAAYMALCDLPRWYVAVLIGGADFRVYELHRNRDLEDVLREAASRFWRDHVLTQIPPPLDGSESARRLLEARWPRNTAPLRVAEPEEEELVRSLLAARQKAAEAESEAERIANLVRERIGDSEGFDSAVARVTWKATKETRKVNWEGVVGQLPKTEQLERIIKAASTVKPGVRRFLVTPKESTE